MPPHAYPVHYTRSSEYYSNQHPQTRANNSFSSTAPLHSRSGTRDSAAQYLVTKSTASVSSGVAVPLIQPVPLQAKVPVSYRNLRDSITLQPVHLNTGYPSGQYRGLQASSRSKVSYYSPLHSEIPEEEPLRPWQGIAPVMQDGFFAIDEYVIIRRLSPDGTYSRWAVGKVMRPMICEDQPGPEERRYLVTYRVSFREPITINSYLEQAFSPSLDEIRRVPDSPPENPDFLTATGRLSIRYDNGDSFGSLKPNCFIFAAIMKMRSSGIMEEVWAPAMCTGLIKGPNLGVSVQIIGGIHKDQKFVVYKIKHYTA